MTSRGGSRALLGQRAARVVPPRQRPGAHPLRGFTLVELLVALTISMGLTLAITLLLIRSETGRRTLTSVNDVASTATYLSHTLDRSLRSAGSGFTQNWAQNYGCTLTAARSGTPITQILPLPALSTFPAPFNTVGTTVRLAPLVVHAGAGAGGSDVLFIAAGSAGMAETALRVQPASATATSLRLSSSLNLKASDLLLLVQESGACMVQQIAAGFTSGPDVQIDLGGTYHASVINGVDVSTVGATARAWAIPMGNINGSRPQIQLIGVNDSAALVAYDLLQLDGINTPPMPIADGVVTLRARYGIDANGDGIIESWVNPGSSPWTAADLLAGSATARDNLRSIAAVRVGLVLRNSTPDPAAVSPDTLTLFADMATALQVSVTGLDTALRHRVLEFTVPLRNQLMPRT